MGQHFASQQPDETESPVAPFELTYNMKDRFRIVDAPDIGDPVYLVTLEEVRRKWTE